MTAIAELRKKAAEKFQGFVVEFESDTLRLKSLLALDEKEMEKFSKAQKTLTELDEEEAEVTSVRDQFVECLVAVAEDKRKARKLLGGESIALLMIVLEEYGASVNEASKSEGAE
jgi:septation ring formation regulator EzrA